VPWSLPTMGWDGRPMKPLIIDSNERGPLPDAVERHAQKMKPPVPLIREKLIVGDYKCGEWYIEAKTVGDFLQSLRNGHLMRQLDNLDANASLFGVVVWGSIGDYVAGVRARGGEGMTVSKATKQVSGGLARIAADFGCLVYRAPNILEASYFLGALHQKTYKAASRHGAQAIKRVSTNDVRFDMLRTIPGIGPEMVDAILDECGSIEEAACADCLRQVPRMGKVLRARVVEALTSETPVRVER
jgi:DNA excision repair protein ERCC-4